MTAAWRALGAGLLAALLQAGPGAAADPFPAGLYQLDPQHSRVAWSVDHLGFSTYRGLIPSVSGRLRIDPAHPEAARLDVTVEMARITTLDATLDQHLHGAQFFDVARHPTASYHADGLTMTGPRTATLQGNLTLCGVTHRVAMNVRFERAGSDPVNGRLTLGFDGSAVVRRSLFGVVAYVPLVGDEAALELEAELVPARADAAR